MLPARGDADVRHAPESRKGTGAQTVCQAVTDRRGVRKGGRTLPQPASGTSHTPAPIHTVRELPNADCVAVGPGDNPLPVGGEGYTDPITGVTSEIPNRRPCGRGHKSLWETALEPNTLSVPHT